MQTASQPSFGSLFSLVWLVGWYFIPVDGISRTWYARWDHRTASNSTHSINIYILCVYTYLFDIYAFIHVFSRFKSTITKAAAQIISLHFRINQTKRIIALTIRRHFFLSLFFCCCFFFFFSFLLRSFRCFAPFAQNCKDVWIDRRWASEWKKKFIACFWLAFVFVLSSLIESINEVVSHLAICLLYFSRYGVFFLFGRLK